MGLIFWSLHSAIVNRISRFGGGFASHCTCVCVSSFVCTSSFELWLYKGVISDICRVREVQCRALRHEHVQKNDGASHRMMHIGCEQLISCGSGAY